MTRGAFTVRVKEELAALRPAAPAERRALLAALLRFAATLHIGGTLGPRYTLVLATGSGGVARLAFWLLHAGYGVRPDLRLREAGALAPRAHYELVLADRVERVLTDNGPCYRALVHALACKTLGIRHLRTRPYRPRTNGKAERFIRTLVEGWAYGAVYRTSAERNAALAGWLDWYNRLRPHRSLGRKPPLSRLAEMNNAVETNT